MIKRITIKNINSIDNSTIDFVKGRYDYHSDMVYKDTLVSPVAMYGYNGTGKSSFVNALFTFSSLLLDDVDKQKNFFVNYNTINKMFDNNENIDIKRFEVRKKYLSSSFEIQFTLPEDNTKIYTYFLSTISPEDYIIKEYLFFNSNGNKEYLFSRNINEIKLNGESIKIDPSMFLALRNLSNKISSGNEVLKEIVNVYQYLSEIVVFDSDSNISAKVLKQKKTVDFLVEQSSDVYNILKKYKHFPKYYLEKNETLEQVDLQKKFYTIKIEANKNEGEFISLPINFISSGMLTQSRYLSIVLNMPEDSFLVIDEIENNLHPSVIKSFIQICNEKNIQLFFTSHNTNILQHLRPDQVYFAKWCNGTSSYRRLSKIYPNIRQVNNIEKMYLSGYFDEE